MIRALGKTGRCYSGRIPSTTGLHWCYHLPCVWTILLPVDWTAVPLMPSSWCSHTKRRPCSYTCVDAQLHTNTHTHIREEQMGCNFIEFNTRLPMLLQSCCRVVVAAASGRQAGRQLRLRISRRDRSGPPTIFFFLFSSSTLLDHSPVNGIRTHTQSRSGRV